jgi:Holliday junction resolvasome RuvABC DNA-binding subunit
MTGEILKKAFAALDSMGYTNRRAAQAENHVLW